MLAPDGRCKTFDARGRRLCPQRGLRVVVLKRLSDALPTATGARADSGLGGESGWPQQRTHGSERSCAAGRDPCGAREGRRDTARGRLCRGARHRDGAGRSDGGAGARGGAGRGPRRWPAVVDRVGENQLGHTEAAAGIAGLMKVVLALQHGRFLRICISNSRVPHIPWSDCRSPFRRYSRRGRLAGRRIAGVSSFGLAAPMRIWCWRKRRCRRVRRGTDRPFVLPLSARTPDALQALARAYRNFPHHRLPALADICYTGSVRRTHHDHRLAMVGDSPRIWHRLSPRPSCRVNRDRRRFVFPGQG